jgi:hypothetical protein
MVDIRFPSCVAERQDSMQPCETHTKMAEFDPVQMVSHIVIKVRSSAEAAIRGLPKVVIQVAAGMSAFQKLRIVILSIRRR